MNSIHPISERSLIRGSKQRLGVNTQLTAHPGQLTVALTLPGTDLQDHVHRALAQLIGVLRGTYAVLA
jgi:hypothetical protein